MKASDLPVDWVIVWQCLFFVVAVIVFGIFVFVFLKEGLVLSTPTIFYALIKSLTFPPFVVRLRDSRVEQFSPLDLELRPGF